MSTGLRIHNQKGRVVVKEKKRIRKGRGGRFEAIGGISEIKSRKGTYRRN